MRLMFAPVLLTAALLAFSSTAQAGTGSVKRLAWNKAVTAWTADAKRHGANKVDCSTWTPTGTSFGCEFTNAKGWKWVAGLAWVGNSCTYRATYSVPRPTRETYARMFVQSQDVPTCDKRWWTRLLTPWSPEVER